ncbi:hypothetical protein Xmau_00630 [Xenorhabdus mauleonii]|uniref:Uncharacterized protein n=1 Tax=Xenorhabdus mauleonii TaxID=351675 RepID=A0A1I3JIV7_9GAMM|nr:hypothetical protein [Xenorhabdus mauleonii]PHM46224.1 hypothetical protein Xmau_00630 [Xenorhabdus mauleonii]SFI60203.1 hypothetical protein SAMN05421680_102225 [Xenorhabdus mauleonii]
MTITIEEILYDAIRETKSVFKVKSYNIGYYDHNMLPAETRGFYGEKGNILRKRAFDIIYDDTLGKKLNCKEIYNYLNRQKNIIFVGNCLLLAIYSLYYLKKIHKHTFRYLFYKMESNHTHDSPLLTLQVISLLKPYSHSFVMVSPPNNNEEKPYLGMQTPPNQFPRDAWICDPWADIICPAISYDEKWKITMSKWNFAGKTVNITHVKVKEDTDLSPLGRYAYTAIQMGRKMIVDMITIYPDGKTILHEDTSSKRCNIL